MKKNFFISLVLLGMLSLISCAEKETRVEDNQSRKCECGGDAGKSGHNCCTATVKDSAGTVQETESAVKPKITFVELGSVRCIPCKKMQPVMASVEKKYGSQIEVVFYDVWTEEHRKYAEQYGIRLIPTQVFLDQNGKEIMRHEGFFPESEIDAFLQKEGLTILTSNI